MVKIASATSASADTGGWSFAGRRAASPPAFSTAILEAGSKSASKARAGAAADESRDIAPELYRLVLGQALAGMVSTKPTGASSGSAAGAWQSMLANALADAAMKTLHPPGGNRVNGGAR